MFEKFCQKLGLTIISVVLENFHPDPEIFNPKLKEWIIEFDFQRLHEVLDYKTPIEFTCEKPQLSKMYSSSTYY
jgi:hypothetical protein